MQEHRSVGRLAAENAEMALQMNPRQRQGLLLVIIAAVGLVGVFLLIADYVSSISKQVGPKIGVVELAQPLVAYQPVTATSLQVVSVPEKWAAPNALRDPAQGLGLVSSVPLPQGTVLEQGMLSVAPTLAPGQRELAILVDGESGVAGQVTPGSTVDIVATFAGNNKVRSSARVIIAGAKVLGVGVPTSNTGQPVAGAGGGGKSTSPAASSNTVVPITFALAPREVLDLSYAESFAAKVRLSLIAPGTAAPLTRLPPYQPLPLP